MSGDLNFKRPRISENLHTVALAPNARSIAECGRFKNASSICSLISAASQIEELHPEATSGSSESRDDARFFSLRARIPRHRFSAPQDDACSATADKLTVRIVGRRRGRRRASRRTGWNSRDALVVTRPPRLNLRATRLAEVRPRKPAAIIPHCDRRVFKSLECRTLSDRRRAGGGSKKLREHPE